MTHAQTIQSAMKGAKLDAILLTSPVNRFYVTGFQASDGVVLLTHGAAHFITDSRYIEAARAQTDGAFTVSLATWKQPVRKQLPRLLEQYRVKKLGFEADTMTVAALEKWQKHLPVKFSPAQKLLKNARQIKNAGEIEAITRAQRIAEAALADTLPLLKQEPTEQAVAAELTYQMMKRGASKNSFDLIVVAGENSSSPHGMPGGRVIRGGDMVTLDIGCVYNGYCSDMTRTFAVGHASEEMKNIYDLVLRAQEAGIAAARGGAAGQNIDAAARDVITEAGFGEYFGHGFGHGLGIEVHEGFSAAPKCKDALPTGSVLTAEPGVYLPGKFGVRIEDMLLLTETGNENLTHFDKRFTIL